MKRQSTAVLTRWHTGPSVGVPFVLNKFSRAKNCWISYFWAFKAQKK